MVKKVNIKTSIKDYKADIQNEGKVAVYDLKNETVIYEGNDFDWQELNSFVEEGNSKANEMVYHVIIVPHAGLHIRSLSWR